MSLDLEYEREFPSLKSSYIQEEGFAVDSIATSRVELIQNHGESDTML